MSWLFSQALVAEYSAATCWDGAPSAPLSVMPTQHKFWRNDKTMEPSQLSRFGLTCAALTADRGEDLLMWFRAASPAPTCRFAGMDQAWMAPKVDCGWSSAASSMKYDPNGRTWRTRQCSLLGGLDEFSGTWPSWGSMHDGECLAHTMPAWITTAPASGLLPTPTASDEKGSVLPETARKRAQKSSRGVRLPEHLTLMGLLPGGRHNPEFSEWLMAWPLRWTGIEPLEMDKFQAWRQQLSPRLQAHAGSVSITQTTKVE